MILCTQVVLLGNADDIVVNLCERLDWQLPSPNGLQPPQDKLKKRVSSELMPPSQPRRVGNSHVWLFDGAEGGKWLADLERSISERNPSTETSQPATSASTPSDSSSREPKRQRVF